MDIDKAQMSQVIQDIWLNASHSMPKGGIVAVTCENVTSGDYSDFPLLPKGRFVKISIQDKGVGMPANVVDKIFDPYFSTKDEKNGTGLGLYMSKTIVEEHHKGRIYVENIDEVRACFFIEIRESF